VQDYHSSLNCNFHNQGLKIQAVPHVFSLVLSILQDYLVLLFGFFVYIAGQDRQVTKFRSPDHD